MKKLILITLLLFSYGFSQQKVSLKIEDCIDIGLKNNKSLHSSLIGIDAAAARYSGANASKLPQLSFTGAYARLSDVPPFSLTMPALLGGGTMVLNPTILNNYQTKVSLAQPLFTGFMLINNSNMNENLLRASEKDYIKDKNELVYKIKEAYWTLYRAKEFEKFINENVNQMEAHLKDVKGFYEQGLATNNQVLQVQVQLSNSKLNQIDARNNVSLAMINLNNILELPLETEIEIASQIEKKELGISDLKNLQQKAFENRPELKSMEYKVDASKNGVSIANSAWYPQIYLSGNYYYNRPNSRIMPTKDEFKDTWDVAVSLQWNFWTWGKTSSKIEEAEVSLAQAQDGLSLIKNGVAMDVTNCYLTYVKTKESITVADEGVKQAEENYKVTNDKFKAGMALNTDLLDAEVALLQAKLNLTQAMVNYELSLAKVRKSIGE
jgi:outer membrane protein